MSLQAWYPFNGNYENLGLGDLDLTVQTSPTYTTGKVTEQSLDIGGFSWTPEQSASVLNNQALSFSFWLKPTASTQIGGSLFVQNPSLDTRRFCIFTYPTLNDLHLDWRSSNGTVLFTETVWNGFFPINTWTHCAITYEYPNAVKIYRNGSLYKALTPKATLDITDFKYSTNLGGGIANRYINDFRVYDHCLSPKEVKEISKGLILHYSLSSPYDIGFTNKYSGATAEGYTWQISGGFTVAKLENERGYNYKLYYVGTGTNVWQCIQFPNFEFTPNKTYQYSCKVRLNKYSSPVVMVMRGARVANDWSALQYSFNNVPLDGQWHTLSIAVTVPATFDLSGTTKTSVPLVEFWTDSLPTSGTVYEMDFDLKDVQVVESEYPIDFIDNRFLDNTIYDVSGYRNNGKIEESSAPKIAGDAARGNNCYHFKDLQTLDLYDVVYENMNKGTVSFWIKFNEQFLNWSHYLQISDSFNWVNQDQDFIIVANKENIGNSATSTQINISTCSYIDDFTAVLNTWYHIVIEWDAENYIIKKYINGSLLSSIDDSSNKKLDIYRDNHCTHFIGNYYLNSAYSGNFNISDFRIYATCLSDSDIQELYNKPISIDNQGVMFATEVNEETTNSVNFEKNGIVDTESINPNENTSDKFKIYKNYIECNDIIEN